MIAFKELIKANKSGLLDSPKSKTLAVLSYFSLIGGQASEANILTLCRYTGLDFSNPRHQTAIYEEFAFHCGAHLLQLRDNGLGLKELLEDPESPYYQQGAMIDTTNILIEIERLKKQIFGEGGEEDFASGDD